MWDRDISAEIARIADELREAIYELIDTLQEQAGQQAATGKTGTGLFPDIEGVDRLPVLFADLSVELQKFQMSLVGSREEQERWTKTLAESIRSVEGIAPGGAPYNTTSRQPGQPSPGVVPPIAPAAMPPQAPAAGPGQGMPFVQQFQAQVAGLRQTLNTMQQQGGGANPATPGAPGQAGGQQQQQQLALTFRQIQQFFNNPLGFAFQQGVKAIGNWAMNNIGPGGLIAGGAALAVYGVKKAIEFPEEQRADNEARIEQIIRPKARLSGELMGAMTGYEIANLVRDMEIANRTSGSSRALIAGQTALKDALKEQDVAMTNLGNWWEGVKTGAATNLAKNNSPLFKWINDNFAGDAAQAQGDFLMGAVWNMPLLFAGAGGAGLFARGVVNAANNAVAGAANDPAAAKAAALAAAGGPIGQQLLQIASGVRIVNPRMVRFGGGMMFGLEPAVPREH